MRKFYFLVAMLLAVGTAWSQNTYTWNGANNASWAVAANWTPTRTTPAAADTLLFTAGNTRIITAIPNETVGRIRVSNNTNITFQGPAGPQTVTIGNNAGDDFIVDAGSTLTQAASLNTITLATGAAANISGTYDIQGAFVLSNANVVATVASTGNLVNSSTLTGATAAKLVVNGTFTHNQDNGTVPTATWNSGSILNLAGLTSNWPAGMGQTFSNLSVTGTITADVDIDAAVTILNDFTLNFAFGAGDELRLGAGSNTDRTIAVGGNFTMTAGNFNIDAANGGCIMNVAGNFSQAAGTITETGSGTATIGFNGVAEQTFTKSGGTISGTVNFSVTAGSIVNFGTSVLNGSAGTFTLPATSKIITSNANGLGATGSIQVTGAKTFSSGADYEFRGASTGTFTTTPTAATLRNLIINNGSGNVTLAQAMTATGVLTLTAGELTTTNALLLTIAAGGSASAATATSFVNGPLAKTGTTAFTFPVGKSGAGFRNIGISAPSTSSTFSAEFFRTSSPAGTLGAGIKQKSACEYWDLARTAGTGSARVTLSWEAGSPCNANGYVTDLSELAVAHLTGGVWVNEGQSGTTGNTTAGTITSGNILSTFSPFALASLAGGANPLPVLFDNVKAYEKSGKVQIEWSNLTERDIVGYTVERSANGRDFTEILFQSPKSNLNEKADYSDLDASPINGSNFYRIKVLEFNGKIIYSKVLRVDMGTTKLGFSLYPNPVIGKQVTIAITGVRQGQYNVRVLNANGQDVFQKTIVNQSSGVTQTLQLPASIKPGVYTMVVSGDNYMQNQLFIVQ